MMRCAYHPTERLTLFCDMPCCLPLCPLCVKPHAQQRHQDQPQPIQHDLIELVESVKDRYVNLQARYTELNDLHCCLCAQTQQLLNQVIASIEKLKTALVERFSAVASRLGEVVVLEFKDKLRKEVAEAVRDIRTQLETGIERVQSRIGELCWQGTAVSSLIEIHMNNEPELILQELQRVVDSLAGIKQYSVRLDVEEDQLESAFMSCLSRLIKYDIKSE